MKFLFKSRERFGDVLLCLPSAFHLSGKGHEVWISCPDRWHPIFEWVSYAKPYRPEFGVPDKTFDITDYDFRDVNSTIVNFVNDRFEELRDVPKDQAVVFDRRIDVPDYGLPKRYVLISPFGYSQFKTPSPEWILDRARRMIGTGSPFFFLSDRERSGFSIPCVTAEHVGHLPALIQNAEELFTINSAPNIIAASVRRSHFHVWDEDDFGGRTNYVVPHRVSLRPQSRAFAQVHSTFKSWYADGGQGSGVGSQADYTAGWRAFLNSFISKYKPKSILDFGCGDWQFSKLVDWGDALYYGVDVVPELIQKLRERHGAPNRVFYTVDSADPELPNSVDLLISKDVLQHMSNADIIRLLPKFQCAKRWLLVNDINPVSSRNNDGGMATGYYQCLDLSAPPFSLKGREVYRFPPQPHTPELPKIAFLVEREDRVEVRSSDALTKEALSAGVDTRATGELLGDLPNTHKGDRESDWWNSPVGYPFYAGLAKLVRPSSILEIGVRLGYSLISMFRGHSAITSIVGVDVESYIPGSNRMAEENLRAAGYGGSIRMISGSSHAVPLGERYDLAHVDGDHTYAGALNDIQRSWDALLPGGVLIVDDVDYLPEVGRAAVRAAETLQGIDRHFLFPSFRGGWLAVKCREQTR